MDENAKKLVEMEEVLKAKKESGQQEQFLMVGLAEQLDPRQPIYRLANEIAWEDFE